MKKRTLYVLTALVLVVSGVVPVFCSDSWGGYLSLAATLLAALCTLLTLVIAIMLYDRFSLEREMAGRQFEEVLKLKRGILSHHMPFFWKDEDGKIHTTWINPNGQLPEVPMYLLDKKRLLWSRDATDELREKQYVNTLMLPEEVFVCYNRLPVHGWGVNSPELTIPDAQCCIGSVVGYPDKGKDDRLYEDINFNNNSLRELCENYARLNAAVDKWLKKYDVNRMLNKGCRVFVYGKEYPKDFKGEVDVPDWVKETYTNR